MLQNAGPGAAALILRLIPIFCEIANLDLPAASAFRFLFCYFMADEELSKLDTPSTSYLWHRTLLWWHAKG